MSLFSCSFDRGYAIAHATLAPAATTLLTVFSAPMRDVDDSPSGYAGSSPQADNESW
jgi:hypothetical protein